MGPTDLINMYRRFLKRRNYSKHTVKNYINILGHFIGWLQIPIEQVTAKQIDAYMDHLLRDRKKPKTINCHLGCIHAFYDYLIEDERMARINPVRKNYKLRLPRPLPKHLRDEQVVDLFKEISDIRDRAMFMLMLRCGLRVEEVAQLTTDAIEYRRRQLYVFNGKGSKDRVVYLSEDALSALQAYMQKRRCSKEKRVFLVQKGPLRGKPISVRGIRVFSFFNRILIRWVRRKYKRFKFHQLRASQWLRGIACKQPWLFAHWGNGFRP